MQETAKAGGDWLSHAEVSVLKGVTWWSQLQEPTRTSRLSRMLGSSGWEFLVFVMIGLNSLFMGLMTDYMLRTARGGGLVKSSRARSWFSFSSSCAFTTSATMMRHGTCSTSS